MEHLQRVWHAVNAYPSGHLVPSPFWDMLVLQLFRPDFSNLQCLYSIFHPKYPFVRSRFCLKFIRSRVHPTLAVLMKNKLAYEFKFTYRYRYMYIDDELLINNPNFHVHLYEIFPMRGKRRLRATNPSSTLIYFYYSTLMVT